MSFLYKLEMQSSKKKICQMQNFIVHKSTLAGIH